MPTIRPLDAYQLSVTPGRALSASFGVFEELVPPVESYPTLQRFGLEAMMPAKFSAARLEWRRTSETAPGGVAPLLTIALTLLQGHEDRAEGRCEPGASPLGCGTSSRSYDRAPVAKDPYQGAAVGTYWSAPSLRLGFTGGTYDADDGTSIRRTAVFADAGAQLPSLTLVRPLSLSLDLRYMKERWRGEAADIRPRVQHSERLTLASSLVPGADLLLGAAVGHSDQNPKTTSLDPSVPPRSLLEQIPVNGYQVEIGYLGTLGKGLTLEVMLSHERREVVVDGQEFGAIYHGDLEDRDGDGTLDGPANSRTLRRMGLALTYQLDDNA